MTGQRGRIARSCARGAVLAVLLLVARATLVAAVLPTGGGGQVDPNFVPVIDPELYVVDIDDPNVVDDVLQDDAYMQEPPDNDPALVTADRQHLNQYQDYAHLYQVIDN